MRSRRSVTATVPWWTSATCGVLVSALALSLCVVVGASAAFGEPSPTSSVDVGPLGTSLIHGDLESTDSTPSRGPGTGAHVRASSVPGGACATTMIGSDQMPVSLCTQVVGTSPPVFAAPTVTLFDPATATVLARLQLAKGGLLGGVYGYLDSHDRVVVADGDNAILRVAHRKVGGRWQLVIDDRIGIGSVVGHGDSLTGLAPDTGGRVWFVSTHGVVGTVDRAGRVRAMHLPAGEDLANGLSLHSGGVSVLSTHALYEVTTGPDGRPQVRWRRAYDRGVARRPGQLTWGSGTTPTYFGPGGDRWVAIVDNGAVPTLLVYDSDSGAPVCRMPAFSSSPQGTENSLIAWHDSVVIPSTYGYQYPPFAVTGPSVPSTAAFTGGLTRVDVSPSGCRRVWENSDRLATLPKLTRADGLINALGYGPYVPGMPQQIGRVDYVATDFTTGRRVATVPVGTAPVDEPLELTGTISRDGVLWQGTLGHMLAIGRR